MSTGYSTLLDRVFGVHVRWSHDGEWVFPLREEGRRLRPIFGLIEDQKDDDVRHAYLVVGPLVLSASWKADKAAGKAAEGDE